MTFFPQFGAAKAGEEPLAFEGARVVLPDRTARVSVRVENGLISGIDVAREGARRVTADGLVLAPAMVDIHGDAFERQLMPRPGVQVPFETAMLETDRQLAGCGIATAYHALSMSWEPGLRSVDQARRVIRGCVSLAGRMAVENRIQLRWETFCFEAEELIAETLAGPLMPAIAFNDHTSMALLHPDVPMQERPVDHAPNYPIAETGSEDFLSRMEERAQRTGLDPEQYIARLLKVWERRAEVPAAIARVAARGRRAGAPMLSHDDSQHETRRLFRECGARIAEFPMSVVVARAARAAGDHVVFGAPNALRGESHLGSPSATAMIVEGTCNVLASDYYYPAMLAAVARLLADGVAPLERLWPLVAANPATALGLDDRGRIATGLRADLVLLDWPEGRVPAPRLTLVAGRPAYAACPATG